MGSGWVGQEPNEVTGVPGPQRNADLAVRLEAADARAVPGARIDDHERSQLRIDRDPVGRHNAHQPVIHGPLEGAAIDHQLDFVAEHVRNGLSITTDRRQKNRLPGGVVYL